jgi:hypothetical protein
VITTRMPVVDIADHERAAALRRELEQLSSDAGAKLLRALGVKGHEAELRSASDEFQGPLSCSDVRNLCGHFTLTVFRDSERPGSFGSGFRPQSTK